jgi:hypothetical protein
MRNNGHVLCAITLFACAWTSHGQLPPDAVDLSLVKIPEKLTSDDLCPVHLLPADDALPTWSHDDIKYRGHAPGCQDMFATDPDGYAESAQYGRWEKNFINAMSIIWCPVTDEIAPGGLIQWKRLGITWESCCQFCNESVFEDDFGTALERLKERAKDAYEKTGGVYVENASSPIEGAIHFLDSGKAEPVVAACEQEPPWLLDRELTPTYTGGAGLILSNRCYECHRDEGTSAVKFQTYEQVRDLSQNIQLALSTRAMPPWPADISQGCFSNSLALTSKELRLLTVWLAKGAPHGEGTLAPVETPFSEWTIGIPDIVYDLPHAIPDESEETVHEFTVTTDFPEDKWIVATQVIPEDVVQIRSVDGGILGSYYPGNRGEILPNGTGRLLEAGATVTVRIHARSGVAQSATAKTRIAIRFADESDQPEKELHANRMENTIFTIPSGVSIHEVSATLTFPSDSKIHTLLPYLRERGKDVTYTAVFPDGRQETLLSIPKWNAKWVMRYQFDVPVAAPKGTVIKMLVHYDNSIDNLEVNDPYQDIKAGHNGEVLEGWISYTLD